MTVDELQSLMKNIITIPLAISSLQTKDRREIFNKI